MRVPRVVVRFQCAHFDRAGGLGLDFRHGNGGSKGGCREFLDMGCRRHRWQWCLVRRLRELGARGFGLLALLVAAATSAAPAPASLALFTGLACGRLALRNGRTTGTFRRSALALERLLAQLLVTILGVGVSLAPLVHALLLVAATVALPLLLRSTLLALAARLLKP